MTFEAMTIEAMTTEVQLVRVDTAAPAEGAYVGGVTGSRLQRNAHTKSMTMKLRPICYDTQCYSD